MDLGVYTLNFATGLLGDEPERIETTMVRLITGVDKQEFVNLIYPNGVVAGLFNTMVSVTDRKGFIYGTEGHIEVENINNYEEFRIYNNQKRSVGQSSSQAMSMRCGRATAHF